MVDAGRLTYQALLKPELRHTALAALDQLRQRKLSPNLLENLIPLYVVLGAKDRAIQMLPMLCAADSAGCSDLAINPMYPPLHGDARFEKLATYYTTITPGNAPASTSTASASTAAAPAASPAPSH